MFLKFTQLYFYGIMELMHGIKLHPAKNLLLIPFIFAFVFNLYAQPVTIPATPDEEEGSSTVSEIEKLLEEYLKMQEQQEEEEIDGEEISDEEVTGEDIPDEETPDETLNNDDSETDDIETQLIDTGSEDSDTPEEDTEEYQALAMIRYKNSDAVSIKFKVSYTPKPYILGLNLAAGYTNYRLLQPFYFGGFLETHLGIPQKDIFPFKYQIDGEAIPDPFIAGAKIYAPFGICVFPFQRNIEVFIELDPGVAFNMIWNTKFGKKAVTSKLFPAFYCALKTGATYKGFSLYAEGNYDAVLGFGVSLGIGYNFNIKSGRQNQTSSIE